MFAAFVLSVALGSAASGPVSPLPSYFFRPDPWGAVPLWVPLEEALDAGGNVRTELFSRYGSSLLRHQLRAGSEADDVPPEECRTRGMDAVDNFPEKRPDRTLDDLVANAARVYIGTITALSVGLLDGSGGSLLQLSDAELLKGGDGAATVYVFHPWAQARRGRVWLCRQARGYRLRPSVGDRILFFAIHPPLDTERSLYEPEATHFVVEGPGGEALHALPGAAALPATFSGCVERVRVLVRANRED